MTGDVRPTVSVVIPCFNSEGVVERAINSALRQTYQPLEILVYDDASTDGTREIVKEIATKNEKIKLFGGQVNVGAGMARDFLLKQCKGRLIAFLDADDCWQPCKLATQVPRFAEDNVGIVTGYQRVIDEERGDLGIRRIALPVGFISMHFTNWLSTSMTVVRADLVEARSMPGARMRQDYAYWLKLMRANRGMVCKVVRHELGTVYRRRGSVSDSPIRNLKANFDIFRTELKYPWFICLALVLFQGLIRVARK